MATSSGNTTISSSGSEFDERKRRRMTSNRESARRSRVRKQQHLDDLMAKIDQLKKENNQLGQTINMTTQQFLKVESENSILRAQMIELTQRLDSLNVIVNDMNALNVVGTLEDDLGYFGHDLGDGGIMGHGYAGNLTHNNVIVDNSPWNKMGYLNQPIMASSHALQYEF